MNRYQFALENRGELRVEHEFLNCFQMHSPIRLLSIDFDGTLVSRVSEPVLDTYPELVR